MNIEQLIQQAAEDGIREGIKSKLTNGYGSPLTEILTEAFKKREPDLRKLLDDALMSALANDELRQQVKTGVLHKLGSLLVARFGGEMERQVNQLKSDPATRARITLAIEEILKDRVAV